MQHPLKFISAKAGHTNSQLSYLFLLHFGLDKGSTLDLDADVSELENEIDQIVYLLYGLDDDEIKIVEEAENV